MPRAVTTCTLVLSLLVAAVPTGHAQSPFVDRHITVAGGMLSWDASGTGESFTLAARGTRAFPARWLAGELGVSYAALNEQFNPDPTRTVAIDLQLQAHAPWTRVQPYLGVGPSLFSYLSEAGGRDRVQPGYSAGVGLRVWPTSRIGFVVDGRLRGWEFAGATDLTVNMGGEATVGLTYRF